MKMITHSYIQGFTSNYENVFFSKLETSYFDAFRNLNSRERKPSFETPYFIMESDNKKIKFKEIL